MDLQQHRQLLVQAAAIAVNFAVEASVIYSATHYDRIPYHTSALTGAAWVTELINGHPECIHCELGVRLHVFQIIVEYLKVIGHENSRGVFLEEQVAIFLYRCTTGLSIRHVGERFQHSNETISKCVLPYIFSVQPAQFQFHARYFTKMLNIFSSSPFYTDFVCLPDISAPVPEYIKDNPKFYPFFEGAIGALDGTHFDCSGTPEQRALARDHKGRVTQNCLAACDFTHKFVYMVSGWEGSVTDSTMFSDARITDLYVPTSTGHYYLADAGFPNSISILIPYRGVRYHLREWSQAELRYCIISYNTLNASLTYL